MGLQGECDGIWAWQWINQLFNWLPLTTLIENKIICMHGGIRRLINHVQQIETLQCPITMEVDFIVFMEFLWYRFCVVVVDLNSLKGTIKLQGGKCQIKCFNIFLLCVNQVRTLCKSNPIENDSVEGLCPNARGPSLVTFGVVILWVCNPFL